MIRNNMGSRKTNTNVFASSKVAITTATAQTDSIRRRRHIAQNFLLIWLNTDIDPSQQDCQNTLTELRNVVNDVNICTQRDECIDFLTDVNDTKAFLILGSTLAEQMTPVIHDVPQLYAIYVFCSNKTEQEQWAKKWVKVKGVCAKIKLICDSLQEAVKQCNQDAVALSFVTVDAATASQNLNQLEPSFMYTQIFKEILLDLKHDRQSIKDFTAYCRDNTYGSPINITRFENEYDTKSAIWWYTFPSFIYSMLNCALRMLEGETIIKMGFFIRDLHDQIKQIYQKQINDYHDQPFIVYRGQGLPKMDFDKLLKTKGGLISFNNFLSTSKKEEVSIDFAKGALTNINTVGILFKISVDPSVSSAPFASIREVSYFKKEEEILFSMHTVFRVGEIIQIDNESPLYQVDLTLTADDDQQLRTLTTFIREETEGETNWDRLSVLLVKIGQFDKAEELFTVLLEQTSDENEKACYYNNLGYIKNIQRDYEKAIWYYKKAVAINEKILPVNHLNLALSYNNIGCVYHNMKEYPEALSFCRKAFEIRRKTLPPTHSVVATSCNNVGSVYNSMGEYPKALSFYEKAHQILRKTLPANHPLLATSYNNIGSTYDCMEEYSKALSFYKKALEIREKTLPHNHPVLATSYINIGGVCSSMGQYSKAVSFYEKALEIREKTLPHNHPDLTDSYNNVGLMYGNMGQYSRALSFYEKALETKTKTLPRSHPHLASSFCNIGFIFQTMGEYSKALSYFERVLDMEQVFLPPNHPNFADAYNRIGLVYNDMGEYAKALLYFERALDIRQRLLPPNHSALKNVRESIENVKKKL